MAKAVQTTADLQPVRSLECRFSSRSHLQRSSDPTDYSLGLTAFCLTRNFSFRCVDSNGYLHLMGSVTGTVCAVVGRAEKLAMLSTTVPGTLCLCLTVVYFP